MMKIVEIKEGGCNNILLYMIKNKLPFYNDESTYSIINDELYYIVTIKDVNMFELFRLTQSYRNKIRVIDTDQAAIPDRNKLAELFPGDFVIDEEKGEKAPLLELAEHSSTMLQNLAMQMFSDSEVISNQSARLFLPMINRTFTIQIPIPFIHFANYCTEDEFKRLYNQDYPNNINLEIVDSEFHSIRNKIMIQFMMDTQIRKYKEKYDNILSLFKYNSLNKIQTNELYKISLVGFSKYDPINRREFRCNLFGANKEEMIKSMKHMGRLKTPLKVDVMIQLPIQHMQELQNTFSYEDLPMIYESSMNNIITNGLIYNDFINHIYDESSEDEEIQLKIKHHEDQISLYKNRIEECNKTVLSAITLLMKDQDSEIDPSTIFALLPSIYKTNALVTIDASKDYVVYDAVLEKMMDDIQKMIQSIDSDMKN